MTNKFIGFLEEIIQKGIESGELKNVNSKITAMSIMVVIEGISWFTIFEANNLSAKEYANTVSDFILSGLTKTTN